MSELTILDCGRSRLSVGSRVSVGPKPEDLGTVTSISDPDGDLDDYSRPVFYPPRVYVKFDDGVEDDFGTSSTARWYDEDEAPYRCDDLEAVSA